MLYVVGRARNPAFTKFYSYALLNLLTYGGKGGRILETCIYVILEHSSYSFPQSLNICSNSDIASVLYLFAYLIRVASGNNDFHIIPYFPFSKLSIFLIVFPMELYRVKQNDKEMVWFLQNRFGGNSQKVEQYIHPQACIPIGVQEEASFISHNFPTKLTN